MWFHSEKLPSAIARYQNEATRVTNVLDSVLKKMAMDTSLAESAHMRILRLTWYSMFPKLKPKAFDTLPTWMLG